MPKGMLTFDLPEEAEEFRACQDGPEWKHLMLDILNHLKNELKYRTDLNPHTGAVYEEIRELIWNSIEERKLKLD